MDDSKLSWGSYGSVWTTNSEDTTIANKITDIKNSYAPTLFTKYENIDNSKGTSTGYSDAKIASYNMNKNGSDTWLSANQKDSYSFERYNYDKNSSNPWLKVIYNHYNGKANRNLENVSTGTEYWLSSRCVSAYYGNADFHIRKIRSDGGISAGRIYNSFSGVNSVCSGIRPVLQILKK